MPLIIAGLGIKFLSHLTKETETVIANSEKILYLANDSLFSEWIKNNHKNSESLEELYFSFLNRNDSYSAITERVLSQLEIYNNLCFIVYGNPNFLVQITTLLTNALASKQHEVHILPAISSLDCLLADLCINPGDSGMQLYEATELIIHKKTINISSHLVIFQPSVIGQNGHISDEKKTVKGLVLLCKYLSCYYPQNHKVVVYEASQYPNTDPLIIKVSLNLLPGIQISRKTSIYIPPAQKSIVHQAALDELKSIQTDFDAPSKKSSI